MPPLKTARDFDTAFRADGVIYESAQLLRTADRESASLNLENCMDSLDDEEMGDVERRELLQNALKLTGAAGLAGTLGHLDAVRATLDAGCHSFALGSPRPAWAAYIAWGWTKVGEVQPFADSPVFDALMISLAPDPPA